MKCDAKGCDREARHQWKIAGRDCNLCSECKLAVQTPWRETPELEEVQTRGGMRGGVHPPAAAASAAADAVPEVPPVDGDDGAAEGGL